MSTVVCQGQQSCLESQLVETRTLRLKLASPRPHFSEPIGLATELGLLEKSQYNNKALSVTENHMSLSNPELGGWSFLQALSNTTQTSPQQTTYVPPKKCSSMLSEKSLKLCTENLGSETGTDIAESSIFGYPLLDFEYGKSPPREQTKPRQCLVSRKMNSRDFPPPLKTMSGSIPVQIRHHREGGRLIINAVEAPSTHAYLQAERSNGRLRMSFVKDCESCTFDSDAAAEEKEESGEENEEDGFENEGKDEKEEEEEEEEENGGVSDACVREDMDGNSCEIGLEKGMESLQRPSRCKEGGRDKEGLCNWEPFWVATT